MALDVKKSFVSNSYEISFLKTIKKNFCQIATFILRCKDTKILLF